MIDINFLKSNPEAVKENIRKKFQDKKLPLVDKVIELDETRRGIIKTVETLKAERNAISQENGKNYFRYTNAQGDKELEFGMCENVFGIFPQTGYSKDVGGESCPGHTYKCATSACWTEPQKFFIKVQVIDTYFGRLNIMFGFRDENTVGIRMSKVAEDFMDEYRGYMTAHRQK